VGQPPDDIAIGDISCLIDYLFVAGACLGLAGCMQGQDPGLRDGDFETAPRSAHQD
jgi:hypothetical protein